MVKIIAQQTFRTFKEFSTNVYKNIMSLGVEIKAERTDIAADQYFKNSLKGGAQKDRGTGSQFVFNGETKFPNDFIDSFSKNSKNKDNLNKNLAQKFLILHESDIILVVILSDFMLSNAALHEPLISSCTSEETDQRIISHAINLADKGCQHIEIRSADTDVIILSVAQGEIIFSKGGNVLNVNCGSGKFYNV